MLKTAGMVTSSDMPGLAGGPLDWIDDVAASVKKENRERAKDSFRKSATDGDAVMLVQSLSEVDIETQMDEHGTRALHLAAMAGHLECVKLLLARGADVHAKEQGIGATALLLAAVTGQLEVAQELVKAGADINVVDMHGNTVLVKAVQSQRVELVEEIVRLGGSPVHRENDGTISTAYFVAQQFVQTDARRKTLNAILRSRMAFIDDGGEMVAEEKYALRQAMLQAAMTGEHETMELLLSIGTEVNCIAVNLTDPSNRSVAVPSHVQSSTPLHLAAGHGQLSCVQFLLDRGADVHLCDVEGHTAYHLACADGHMECVRALYHAGSDTQAVDKQGRTGRLLAQVAGEMDVVSLIDELARRDEEGQRQRAETERQNGLLQEATDLYNQGDYDAALHRSTDLIVTTKGPVKAQALCIRAKCHLAGHRFVKSRKDIASALNVDSECSVATQLQSAVDLQEAQYDKQQAEEREQQLIEKQKREAASRKAKEEKRIAREQQAVARQAQEAEKRAAQEQARLKAQEEKEREATEIQRRAAIAEERRQETHAKELARRREEESLAAVEAAKQAASVAAAAKAASKAAAEREAEQARVHAEAKAKAQAHAKAQADRQTMEGATVNINANPGKPDSLESNPLKTAVESEVDIMVASVQADASATPSKRKKGKHKKRTQRKNQEAGGAAAAAAAAAATAAAAPPPPSPPPPAIAGDEGCVTDEPDVIPEIVFGSGPGPEPEPEPELEPDLQKSAAALTAVSSYNAFLATLSPEQARQEVGMQLFNVVQGHLSMMTAKITGMLLENDLSTLTPLLTDPDRTQLTGRIDQATAVILQAAAEMSATTSDVIAGSSTTGDAKNSYDTRGEEMLQMPTAGSSVGSPPHLSPVPANWQQPMVPMHAPLSPPHAGQLQQMAFGDTCNLLQQLPVDISTWNSQEALIWFTRTFSFADVYQPAFCQLRVDGDLLQHLTEDDLRDDLGMRSSIHRRAVMRAISALSPSAD